MTWLKQFLKPNRWKVGIFLILAIPTLAFYSVDLVQTFIGCKSMSPFFPLECENQIGERIARIYNTFFIVFGVLILPLITMPVWGLLKTSELILDIDVDAQLPRMLSVAIILLYFYLLSCFIYLVFRKIKGFVPKQS